MAAVHISTRNHAPFQSGEGKVVILKMQCDAGDGNKASEVTAGDEKAAVQAVVS